MNNALYEILFITTVLLRESYKVLLFIDLKV